MPGLRGVESWTVLGDGQVPVEPMERFLAYLSSIEKSPKTVKAHDLKDWFTYLAGRGLDWRAVTVEQVAGFIAWLRLPPEARDGTVAMLPAVGHHYRRGCSPGRRARHAGHPMTLVRKLLARHGLGEHNRR